MKLEKETAEQLRQGNELRLMVQSEGWQIAKALLMEQVHVLSDVGTLPTDLSFEEIGRQAMYRAHAIALVRSWLDTIEGRLEQHTQQAGVLAEEATDEIVRIHK